MDHKGGFMLFICEAKLSTSVALVGSMNVFVSVLYGDLCTESKVVSGENPSWNEVFHFDRQKEDLEVVVSHKPLFFPSVEVGRVSVRISKQAEWFEIRKAGKRTGVIRLIIQEEPSRHSTSYSTAGSWDMECLKKMNELELKKEESMYYKNKILEINSFSLQDLEHKREELKLRAKQVMKEENLIIQAKAQIKKEKENLELEMLEIKQMQQELEQQFAQVKVLKYRERIEHKVNSIAKKRRALSAKPRLTTHILQ